MSKKGILQNAVVIVLGLAIISMSIGYAAFDNKAVSSGASATFEKANWDVHLENPIKTINSTILDEQIITVPTISSSGTELSFSINLKPGDIYEFTVDVKNAGTFNAKLSNYSLTTLKDGVPYILDDGIKSYELDGVSYEIMGITQNELLNKGDINTKTIRISSKSKDLPNSSTENLNYEFKLNMTYTQVS